MTDSNGRVVATADVAGVGGPVNPSTISMPANSLVYANDPRVRAYWTLCPVPAALMNRFQAGDFSQEDGITGEEMKLDGGATAMNIIKAFDYVVFRSCFGTYL